MEARMLTGFEVLERDQAGYSQVNSLYAMIAAMSASTVQTSQMASQSIGSKVRAVSAQRTRL